jgi:hypothetical protein
VVQGSVITSVVKPLVNTAGVLSLTVDNTTLDVSGGGALEVKAGGIGSSQLGILTTKGDILVYGTSATRLPVGTNGQVLTADSTQADGLKWSSASAGTVTSVALSDSTGLFATVTGSPVTTSGTLSFATLTAQTQKTFFAGPTSGANAAPTFRTIALADLPGGVGLGSVTSVGLADSTGLFTISGTPVTTSGTLTLATLVSQAKNIVFAGPTSGANAAPTFRSLVAADLGAVLTVAGDILIENATPTPARLPIGTTGQVLTVVGGLPAWSTISGTGSVTSVAMTVPSFLQIGGSPVTTSGTLAITLATETANLIFAGPTTGAAAAPTFRGMTAHDLNTVFTNKGDLIVFGGINAATLTVGTNGFALVADSGQTNGVKWAAVGSVTSVAMSVPGFLTIGGSPITSTGTLALDLATESANTVFAGPASGAAAKPTFRALAAADVTGVVFPVLSADPGSPTAGQGWFNSTQQQVTASYGNDGVNFVNGNLLGMLFNFGLSRTVTANTSAQTFTSYLYTFPAGFLNIAGRLMRMRIYVTFGQTVLNSFTFNINLKSSHATVALDSVTTTSVGGQNGDVIIDADITCISTGSSGVVRTLGILASDNNAVVTTGSLLTFNNATVDLTQQLTLQFSASAAVTNGTDTCVMKFMRLELMA